MCSATRRFFRVQDIVFKWILIVWVKYGLGCHKIEVAPDVIHLKFAELHCNKLVTFDSDFEKLKAYTHLEIEILK